MSDGKTRDVLDVADDLAAKADELGFVWTADGRLREIDMCKVVGVTMRTMRELREMGQAWTRHKASWKQASFTVSFFDAAQWLETRRTED